MGALSRLLHSTVGGKLIMAVTGAGLVLFTIAHMAGNLLAFSGPKAMNEYAQGLADLGPLLWLARAGLLVFLIYHVLLAFRLTGRNRAARPTDYAERRWKATPFTSRFMLVGGVALLAFILMHLAHFTFGWLEPETFAHSAGRTRDGLPDVYGMVVASFKKPVYAVVYVVAMGFLATHLAHGASSLFQTLGLNHPKYNPILTKVGPTLAVVLTAGFAAVPLGVLFGVIQ